MTDLELVRGISGHVLDSWQRKRVEREALRALEIVRAETVATVHEASMRVIWKYKVEVVNTPVNHNIPRGAEPVFVGLSPDTGNVSVWFNVPDSKAKTERRTFLIHGTGNDISPYEKYIGSVIEGQFVWHVFEAML